MESHIDGVVLLATDFVQKDEKKDERVDHILDMINRKHDWNNHVWGVKEATSSEFEEAGEEKREDQAADTERGENSHVAENVDGTADVSGRNKRNHADRGADCFIKRNIDTDMKNFLEGLVQASFTTFGEKFCQQFSDRLGKIETEVTQLRTASEKTEQFETVVTDRLGRIEAEVTQLRTTLVVTELVGKSDQASGPSMTKINTGPSTSKKGTAPSKKKISQDGKIGIVLSPFWVEPYDVNSHADKEAVERALDYYLGWHLDPLIFGDYPKAIKRNAGKRLPSFTRKQTEMIRNSFDFIGINYYSARYVTRQLQSDPSRLRFTTDQHVEYKVTNRDGDYISSESDELKFIYVYPEGLRKLLNHIKNKYNNPTIYITENGYDDYDVGTVPREQLLKDTKRIEYHEKHLQELHKAITEDGCDVRGYSAWSLLDNFEWEHGYTMRFGLYYVDYADDLKRYAKDSAKWFKKFLERKEQATPLDLFNSIKKWWSALQMV
ncbi:hypothetical protein Bca52824_049774 [Brassica carinata]|uniref:thioglucosidase n=1 Tax=Brassica carinata TaxID=52824 RepID=A0A8X7RNY9_BRACI|nr:hypothetical protein Bca52824_049774 [Brassica carinata]